jgi:hypothetical protein
MLSRMEAFQYTEYTLKDPESVVVAIACFPEYSLHELTLGNSKFTWKVVDAILS